MENVDGSGAAIMPTDRPAPDGLLGYPLYRTFVKEDVSPPTLLPTPINSSACTAVDLKNNYNYTDPALDVVHGPVRQMFICRAPSNGELQNRRTGSAPQTSGAQVVSKEVKPSSPDFDIILNAYAKHTPRGVMDDCPTVHLEPYSVVINDNGKARRLVPNTLCSNPSILNLLINELAVPASS